MLPIPTNHKKLQLPKVIEWIHKHVFINMCMAVLVIVTTAGHWCKAAEAKFQDKDEIFSKSSQKEMPKKTWTLNIFGRLDISRKGNNMIYQEPDEILPLVPLISCPNKNGHRYASHRRIHIDRRSLHCQYWINMDLSVSHCWRGGIRLCYGHGVWSGDIHDVICSQMGYRAHRNSDRHSDWI